MNVCALCGKKKTSLTVKGKRTLRFCKECTDVVQKATFVNDHPIVWADRESLLDRYEDDEDARKEIYALNPDDFRDIANHMADSFWNDQGNGDWWADNLCEAFERQLVDNEEVKLRRMKKSDLPLMIGNIKHEENEKILSDRLKGE